MRSLFRSDSHCQMIRNVKKGLRISYKKCGDRRGWGNNCAAECCWRALLPFSERCGLFISLSALGGILLIGLIRLPMPSAPIVLPFHFYTEFKDPASPKGCCGTLTNLQMY